MTLNINQDCILPNNKIEKSRSGGYSISSDNSIVNFDIGDKVLVIQMQTISIGTVESVSIDEDNSFGNELIVVDGKEFRARLIKYFATVN